MTGTFSIQQKKWKFQAYVKTALGFASERYKWVIFWMQILYPMIKQKFSIALVDKFWCTISPPWFRRLSKPVTSGQTSADFQIDVSLFQLWNETCEGFELCACLTD